MVSMTSVASFLSDSFPCWSAAIEYCAAATPPKVSAHSSFEVRSRKSEASWVLFLLVFERIGACLRGVLRILRIVLRLLSYRLTAIGSCFQWQAVCEIAPKLGIVNESLRR